MSKLIDVLGSAGSLFRLGIGGNQLRSQSGVIEARDPTNAAYTSLRSSDLILNGIRVSAGSTVPTSPAVGDRWMETDGTNKPLYGWEWWWDGTYWRSPDMVLEASDYNDANGAYKHFVADSTFGGYYLKYWIVISNVLTTNDASNFWNINLYRYASPFSGTTLFATSTSTFAPTTFTQVKSAINLQVNLVATGAKTFAISFQKTGVPGNIISTAKVVYNLTR